MQAAPAGKLEPAVPLREAAQSAALVMVVVQVEPRQQTPGGRQGLGVQEPPTVKVPVQEACRTKEQTPAVSQQVPGCGQGLGVQVPAAVKVPAQARESVAVQAETLQHEPAGLLAVTMRLIVPVAVEKEPTRIK